VSGDAGVAGTAAFCAIIAFFISSTGSFRRVNAMIVSNIDITSFPHYFQKSRHNRHQLRRNPCQRLDP
jgi:hypothetical protein